MPRSFTLLQINEEREAPWPALWAVDPGRSRDQTQDCVRWSQSPPGIVHSPGLGGTRVPSLQGHFLPNSLPFSLTSPVSQGARALVLVDPAGWPFPGTEASPRRSPHISSPLTPLSSFRLCPPSAHTRNPAFPQDYCQLWSESTGLVTCPWNSRKVQIPP